MSPGWTYSSPTRRFKWIAGFYWRPGKRWEQVLIVGPDGSEAWVNDTSLMSAHEVQR